MTRARWISVLVAAGLLVSCGEGLAPPTTGSIALDIRLDLPQQDRGAPVLSRAAEDTGGTATQTSDADASAPGIGVSLDVAAFTAARASAIGPTNKTVNLQLVDNFWEGTLADLNAGSYSVVVEGLVDGEITARGTQSGITVTAGQQSTASVSLVSFVPSVTLGIGSPTTSLVIPVTVSSVTGAEGYRLEWANNANFSGAASKNVSAGANSISLSALGSWYVRARALSGTTVGGPGAAGTVDVVGDVPATGADPGSALGLGFGAGATQRLTQLNIVPANDEDWFGVDACRSDTIVLETFAARLTPVSGLNSYLRVFAEGGPVLLDENDDLDGTTTDSRIQVVAPDDGRYLAQVTSSAGGSVGQYELGIEVRPGPNNDGSGCAAVTVTVTPATATIAPGATQQLTASATDAGGSPVTGINFFWVSSNTSVAVVDTTGLVTGVGGGTATISASGLGEPGNAVITVTGPPLGAPSQLAFSGQPTTTNAGAAFSPAIEVEVRDGLGNLVTGARNAVTIAVANNPGGATLYGTKTVSANGGIAKFTGLYMDKAATGYTLTASATSLSGATSNGFTINPGAPARLSFGQQPTDVEGNVALTPAVTATVVDAFGNVATGATNAVTLGFGVNVWQSPFSPGATLLGTKTANAVNGVATFSDLRVDKPGAGYTLAATAAGLSDGSSAPFAVNLTVQSVRAGQMGYHTCAVTSGGTYCWGSGGNGQLGDGLGTYSNDSVPRLVSGGITFTQVTTGGNHTCALTAAGAAYCWGYNGYGQLGDNSTTQSDAPVAVSGGHTFSSLSAGYTHTCGIEGTALYCWGNNGNGQLGDNSTTQRLVPTQVSGGLNWGSVSAGTFHTCALTTGGSAYCWGNDGSGQLGNDATIADSPVPVAVAGGLTWASLTPSYQHTCGVDVNGNGYCWGTNLYGRLGADTTAYPRNSTQPTPVPVFGGLAFATIATGYYHSCGVTTGGSAYCWGQNGSGQLGDGSTVADSPLRVAVSGGITFSTGALSAGRYYTCGRAGTEVWCWGYGGSGNLGNGAAVNKNQPVQIVQ